MKIITYLEEERREYTTARGRQMLQMTGDHAGHFKRSTNRLKTRDQHVTNAGL